MSEAFLAEGATVIGADLRFPDAPPRPGLSYVTLDATDLEALAAAAAANPDVGVLVNCVGFVAHGALLDHGIDEFDRTMEVNVRSMVLSIGSFLPAMLRRGAGSIINIASVVSSVMAAPNRFAYGTSKAAVVGLTMSIARDYIERGIRCNSIQSRHHRYSVARSLRADGQYRQSPQEFIARQPMGEARPGGRSGCSGCLARLR